MDLETQKQFLATEKQKHIDALTALQAIEDTITEKTTLVIASLQPLTNRVAELEPLVPENETLKERIKELEVINSKVDEISEVPAVKI